jgi:hypothetical protein
MNAWEEPHANAYCAIYAQFRCRSGACFSSASACAEAFIRFCLPSGDGKRQPLATRECAMFHELFRIVIDTSVQIALAILPAVPLLGQRLRMIDGSVDGDSKRK